MGFAKYHGSVGKLAYVYSRISGQMFRVIIHEPVPENLLLFWQH